MMQINDWLLGAKRLTFIKFLIFETLGSVGSEREIEACIDRHDPIFTKPVFKGVVDKREKAGLLGPASVVNTALTDNERLDVVGHRVGAISVKASGTTFAGAVPAAIKVYFDTADCARFRAPPRRVRRCAIRLALGGLLLAAGAAAAEPSVRERWLAAVDLNSSTWSRESLLHGILAGTVLATREQAIALLGAPNYSADLYSPGKGLTARIDEYRLSATNLQALRLDSSPDGQLKNPTIEGEGCACPLCRRAMKARGFELKGEKVTTYIETLKAPPDRPKLLGTVESAVGVAGVHEGGEGVFGNRPYWTAQVIWRLADDAHRFFTVSGRTLLRDYRTDADVPVWDFAVVTVSDVCLAP